MPRLIPQSNKLVSTVALFVLIMLALFAGNDASGQRRRRPAQKAPQQQGANTNTSTSTAQTKPQKKNITPLRGGDTANGSRLTITSDVPLNDYSAYRSGDRYYVEIPDANAPRAASGLRGRGFEDVQVQKRGDNAIISFKLQPGATARVSQKFNRLDVELSAPGKSTATVTPTSAPTPATTPQATPRSTPQTATTTPTPAIASTAGQGNQTTPGITGVNTTPGAIPPGAQTIPPTAEVQPPDASASPGASPEANPLATPPVDQIAQAQPQAETQPITQPVSAAPSSSFGATLARNWMLILIVGVVLASLLLFVAARSRTRGASTTAATPARRLTRKERLAARAKTSDKLSEVAASDDAASAKSAIVLKPGTLPKAVKITKDEEKPALAVAEETKEVEAVTPVDVERIELEVKNLLSGESYDEALLGSSEAETRQLVATELLSALASRNVERRERARTAFVKHDYLDEATRNLRTAGAAAERASAARSLGYVADKSTTPHLIAALEDEAPEVRRAAVEALADMGDPAAAEPLQSLLKRERDKKVPLSLIERAISASTAVVEEEETTTLTSAQPVVEQEETTLETAPAVIGEADKPPIMEKMGLASEAATVVLEEEETVTEVPEVEPSVAAVAAEELVGAEAATQTEEEERQRLEVEAEARRAAEEEEFRVEAARLEQEERERLALEEAEREEQARLAAEARRLEEEEAARLKAEAEAEAQRKAEEEARLEEERRLAAEAEAQRQAEEEAARQQAAAEAEATRLRAEEEEHLRLEEEKRLAAEAAAAEEARLKAEEEERLRVEEEQRRAEEEARLAAEAEAQRKAEEEAEARRQAEEEARLAAEAEAEARRKAEEEAEAARLRAEEEAARLKAEAEAEAEAQRKADEEAARLRDEENARRLAAEEAAAALQAEAISPVEHDLTEPEPVEASSPVLPFEPAIERDDGSAEGWVEVDIAEPVAASTEEAAVETDASPEVKVIEPLLESSVVVEEPAVAAPASKEIEYAVTEKGVDIFDENTTVPRAILRRLSSEEPDERASAVIDLARVGGDDSFREINAAFDDPAVEVRNAAARSLFNVHTDRAATFTRALREAPPERRRKIGAALASSGLASEAIGQLMGESREKTYDAFSLLFLMSKAGEVQPLMRAIEEHPNNEVRLAVIKLLALSGQQEILPAFRRLAVRGSLPTEVRSAVMEAIYQLSSQSPTAA